MSDYKDPEKLAWAIHTSNNYSEAADKLGCATGTISVWKSKLSKELKQYSSSDFDDDGTHIDVVEFEPEEVESKVKDMLSPYDYTQSDSMIRYSSFGLAIELSSSVEKVAGKDLNPFIAISEHKLVDNLEQRAREHDVGIIVATNDGIYVVVDSAVTEGSGLRATLTPEKATTTDKYTSRTWLQQQKGRDAMDIAEECQVRTPTVRTYMNQFSV